jgi:VWFA-related protein
MALSFVTLTAAAALAQSPGQTAAPQQPTFRTRIDSVSVDVTVTDKQGRPVNDLKAEDFEITENKKPQAVQTFKLIQIDDTIRPDPIEPDITSMDAMQREAARDDTRILAIFLDDYHVRRGNAMRIREELARFVSQLSSHDLVAIVYPLTPVGGITLSRNHDGTAAALMSFDGRKFDYTPKNAYEMRYADYPPEMQEVLRRQVTISALEGLALFLGTLREGKKQIVFVSEGLVGTMPPGTQTTGTMPLPRRGQPTNTQDQQDRAAFLNQVDVLNEMKRVFVAASRSNTSIYTLDPRGLATSEFQINDDVNSENDRRTLNEAISSLRVIADQTDGRAIVSQNNPAPSLRQMLTDTSAYYLLGYTSTEAPRDGKFHEIQVRVKRRDVQVRARKGYWAFTNDDVARAESAPKEGPPPAVEDAFSSLASVSRTRGIRVWVGAERGADEKARVTLAWETAADPAAEMAGRAGLSRGPDPDAVDHIRLTATSIYGDTLFQGIVPRDPQSARPGGRVNFTAPPGTVRLQIVGENTAGQRVERADEASEIPDFTAVGPLISTPAIYRGRTVRELQTVRTAERPMPAIGRDFSRTERLLFRFQAYGPGDSTPTVTLRLLNSVGKAMASLPAPTRTPDGTFEEEFGLGGLAPGSYLVEINAESPSGKQQTLVAFRVTG